MVQSGVTITGGTLQGSGTVRSNVNNTGGTVGPGNSPGTLTVDSDYTQGSGGTLAMEIDSLLSFDVLDFSGIAALGRYSRPHRRCRVCGLGNGRRQLHHR